VRKFFLATHRQALKIRGWSPHASGLKAKAAPQAVSRSNGSPDGRRCATASLPDALFQALGAPGVDLDQSTIRWML
ncbi:hypothetical protein, partial [Candidatus Accumulibacter aalborgensis]|uniref:hypothetical protein n=1 Tax=Candidatus Accumulibacter aalborgensis TaxID=1860102 RepID=UPI001C91FDCF